MLHILIHTNILSKWVTRVFMDKWLREIGYESEHVLLRWFILVGTKGTPDVWPCKLMENKDPRFSCGRKFLHYRNRGEERWQQSGWTWSASLSMDTSGIHLQTQKCMQNTSWEWTGVPDQWKKIQRPTQTRDQALSLWSGSTDSKTLDYQRTNPREYQIVRTHTKEATWIQDLASFNNQ